MTKILWTMGAALGVVAQRVAGQQSFINGVLQNGAAIIGHVNGGNNGTNGPPAVRSFGVDSPFAGFLIDYGCWCFFDGNAFSRRAGRGKGGAVDAFDATCRRLQLGYRCAIMDAQDAGGICHPWGEVYPMIDAGIVGTDKSNAEISDSCTSLFPDNTCGQHACILETNFLNELQDLIDTGATMVETFKHSNTFDVTAECVRSIQVEGDNDCCGDYPERYPFRTAVRECCIDGNSAPIGRC